MHVKGTVDIGGGRFDDPPAGMDSINWGLLVAIMRKHGYNGVMSIEPHSETWQGELGAKGIAFTIKMMKQLLFIED
jgi:sugar phosphate isomerase/epimerase